MKGTSMPDVPRSPPQEDAQPQQPPPSQDGGAALVSEGEGINQGGGDAGATPDDIGRGGD
jgi:hypothetical protein